MEVAPLTLSPLLTLLKLLTLLSQLQSTMALMPIHIVWPL